LTSSAASPHAAVVHLSTWPLAGVAHMPCTSRCLRLLLHRILDCAAPSGWLIGCRRGRRSSYLAWRWNQQDFIEEEKELLQYVETNQSTDDLGFYEEQGAWVDMR
jgi:hypothetical protein